MEQEEKSEGGGMRKIAAFIVDKRNLFFLLYVVALVFCLFSRNWVEVENDIPPICRRRRRPGVA